MKKETLWPLTPTRIALAIAPLLGAAASQPALGPSAASPATLHTVTVTSDWLGAPTAATARTHPGARSIVDEKALDL